MPIEQRNSTSQSPPFTMVASNPFEGKRFLGSFGVCAAQFVGKSFNRGCQLALVLFGRDMDRAVIIQNSQSNDRMKLGSQTALYRGHLHRYPNNWRLP
jgi:hypothetical protein